MYCVEKLTESTLNEVEEEKEEENFFVQKNKERKVIMNHTVKEHNKHSITKN